jgi:hypothetical protein
MLLVKTVVMLDVISVLTINVIIVIMDYYVERLYLEQSVIVVVIIKLYKSTYVY